MAILRSQGGEKGQKHQINLIPWVSPLNRTQMPRDYRHPLDGCVVEAESSDKGRLGVRSGSTARRPSPDLAASTGESTVFGRRQDLQASGVQLRRSRGASSRSVVCFAMTQQERIQSEAFDGLCMRPNTCQLLCAKAILCSVS